MQWCVSENRSPAPPVLNMEPCCYHHAHTYSHVPAETSTNKEYSICRSCLRYCNECNALCIHANNHNCEKCFPTYHIKLFNFKSSIRTLTFIGAIKLSRVPAEYLLGEFRRKHLDIAGQITFNKHSALLLTS